jgi:uncharacterized protein (DUF427 family)
VTDKPIKIPGPDHSISIGTNPCRVVVKVGGTIIADTHAALTLREGSYPAVQYIPRRDVDMTLLARSYRTTYCPYKGDASYFSIPAPWAVSARSMLCGPTRPPMWRSRASRTTSHSTLIKSIRSKSSAEQFFFRKDSAPADAEGVKVNGRAD